MKINILGTDYDVVLDAQEKDYPSLKKCDGYTDFSVKRIVISKQEKDDMSLEDLDSYSRLVLRHEIVHAFMYESGLDKECSYARNEELIDWIAIQFEEILNAFKKVGAITHSIETLNISLDIDARKLAKEVIDNMESIETKT